jgi:branched-chain amino acid transport system permease protein
LCDHRLRRLPIGRAWEALREDEIACRSLGINTTTTKLTAFAMGAMFGGFAGEPSSLSARASCHRKASSSSSRPSFLPSSFWAAWAHSARHRHRGHRHGGRHGTSAPAGLPEGNPGFSVPISRRELYRMLIFGLAMVVVMLYKPRGFVGTRRQPRTSCMPNARPSRAEFTKEGHG